MRYRAIVGEDLADFRELNLRRFRMVKTTFSESCTESKHVAWDDIAKLYRVHMRVDDRHVYLGSFREGQEALSVANAALFLLGRSRSRPDRLPSKSAITKVRVKLAAERRSRSRSPAVHHNG